MVCRRKKGKQKEKKKKDTTKQSKRVISDGKLSWSAVFREQWEQHFMAEKSNFHINGTLANWWQRDFELRTVENGFDD